MADMNSGSIARIGNFAQDTPPRKDPSVVWIDTSEDPSTPKIYDPATDSWMPVNTTGQVVSETKPQVQTGIIWFNPSDSLNGLSGTGIYTNNGKRWDLLQFVYDIPDSSESRPSDNHTSEGLSSERGIAIEVASTDWSYIQARISTNSSGFTRGYVRQSDGTVITSVDISGKSAGDVVTFSGVNLNANTTYYIDMDAEGSSYTIGSYNSPNYPYDSNNQEISITAGSFDGTSESSGTAWGYEAVGNINL